MTAPASPGLHRALDRATGIGPSGPERRTADVRRHGRRRRGPRRRDAGRGPPPGRAPGRRCGTGEGTACGPAAMARGSTSLGQDMRLWLCVRSDAIRRSPRSRSPRSRSASAASPRCSAPFDAVLIRPLPYADADRLVMIWDWMGKQGRRRRGTTPTPANGSSGAVSTPSSTDLARTQPGDATLSGDGEPEQVPARKVTWNFWSVLGVQPHARPHLHRGRGQQGRAGRGDQPRPVAAPLRRRGRHRRTQDLAQRRALRSRSASCRATSTSCRRARSTSGCRRRSRRRCGRTSAGTTPTSSRGSSLASRWSMPGESMDALEPADHGEGFPRPAFGGRPAAAGRDRRQERRPR